MFLFYFIVVYSILNNRIEVNDIIRTVISDILYILKQFMLKIVNTSKTNKGVQVFERMTYCELYFAKKCIETQSISLKLFAADIYNDIISIINSAEQCMIYIL